MIVGKQGLHGIYKLGIVGAQLLIVKSKAQIVFKVEFQTSLRQS